MDAQIDEARRLREEITKELAQVQQLFSKLAEMEEASGSMSSEEQAIKSFLWDLYEGYKHRDHIIATFIAARRRRMLQRLQAAHAALEQARAFLTADAATLPYLQKTISEAQAVARALHGPPPESELEAQAAEPEEEEEDIAAEEAQAAEQPEAASPAPGSDQEKEAELPEKKEADEQRRELLRVTSGGDDAAATRAALADFEQRARVMRNAISIGRGWFEWYFIPRGRKKGKYGPQATLEALEYLRRGEIVPADVQYYKDEEKEEQEDTQPPYGPYLRYRWYEGGGRKKPIKYSLGMGLIKPGDQRRNEPPPTL
jgi:hypothetical protein